MTTETQTLRGHVYEVENVCAHCKEQLRNPRDGHYHSRMATAQNGMEPICCFCACANKGSEVRSGADIPEIPEELAVDEEIFAAMKETMSEFEKLKITDIQKRLGDMTDEAWYKIRDVLYYRPNSFERVSSQYWRA